MAVFGFRLIVWFFRWLFTNFRRLRSDAPADISSDVVGKFLGSRFFAVNLSQRRSTSRRRQFLNVISVIFSGWVLVAITVAVHAAGLAALWNFFAVVSRIFLSRSDVERK